MASTVAAAGSFSSAVNSNTKDGIQVTLWGLAARQGHSGPLLHRMVPRTGGMAADSSQACGQRVRRCFVLLRPCVGDDERADPCTEQLAARLYRSCGPDAAVKSVIRVNFKSTCSSCSEQIRRC